MENSERFILLLSSNFYFLNLQAIPFGIGTPILSHLCLAATGWQQAV
jgi:hypothetical protein